MNKKLIRKTKKEYKNVAICCKKYKTAENAETSVKKQKEHVSWIKQEEVEIIKR